MAKKRRKKLTRKQEKAIFAKKKSISYKPKVYSPKTYKPKMYKPKLYKPKLYKPKMYRPPSYNPNKPFPKNVDIKIPTSSPTFSIPDVDKSIKKLMKELYGK